jgi:23S rRNA (adenine2030-N6)-methyltransferase
LAKSLQTLDASWLRVELMIDKPRGEFGMCGSGMFLINPPWTLHEQLKLLMPQLQTLLANAEAADFVLEHRPAKS